MPVVGIKGDSQENRDYEIDVCSKSLIKEHWHETQLLENILLCCIIVHVFANHTLSSNEAFSKTCKFI